MWRLTSFIGLIGSFLFLSSMARANTIIVDASVSGTTGAYTYAYEIENETSVGLLLFSLTVTGDVGTIQSPAGWLSTTAVAGVGETLVEWISTDVPYDVPASGSLSGFSLSSDSDPGSVAFLAFDEDFNEFDGQTPGPVAPTAPTVPEPTSFVLMGASLVGVYILRMRLGNMKVAWTRPGTR